MTLKKVLCIINRFLVIIMKIHGTGIDIVEVKRIKKLLLSNGRFRDRVFTAAEVKYCENKKKKHEHYAVRFAAKEAVWKAMGKGGVGLKSIEIKNDPNGAPRVFVKHKLPCKGSKIIITLSHTDNYAVAHAMVVS